MYTTLTHSSRRDAFLWKSTLYNHKSTHTVGRQTDTWEMKISALLISLILSRSLCEVNLAFALKGSWDGLRQGAWLTEDKIGAGVSTEVSSVRCKLQSSTRLPAFSLDGDYVIGGVLSIHSFMQTVRHNYTTMPEPQKCTGRLVRGRCDVYGAVTLCAHKCEDLYHALAIMLQIHRQINFLTEKCIELTGKPKNSLLIKLIINLRTKISVILDW